MERLFSRVSQVEEGTLNDVEIVAGHVENGDEIDVRVYVLVAHWFPYS